MTVIEFTPADGRKPYRLTFVTPAGAMAALVAATNDPSMIEAVMLAPRVESTLDRGCSLAVAAGGHS